LVEEEDPVIFKDTKLGRRERAWREGVEVEMVVMRVK
jgi:hypothetical protein